MSMDFEIRQLQEHERQAIKEVREVIIDNLRNTPEVGVEVEYLGRNFHVEKGVFWPRPDSVPLVENFVIHNGDDVLDVCTGSGVIAIFSALKGARKVVAVDINPDAVKSAKINAERFGVNDKLDVRISDVLSAVKEGEQFDVITGNLPFTDEPSDGDMASRTLRDPGLRVAREFFSTVSAHLRAGGRLYISQANSGNVYDMLDLAQEAGFIVKLIGKKEMGENSLEFYAFELRKKSNE